MASAGSTTARGYGPDHQKERARAKQAVDAGEAYCWRCGGWIDPTLRDKYGREMWDLGHDDHDRSVYRGPEHRRCNRRAGALKSNQRRRKPRRWAL